MGDSKNLKDRVPNPTLKSSMPPNKKEVKSGVIYSISQIRFYEQPKKGRNHRSKKYHRNCDHEFDLEAI